MNKKNGGGWTPLMYASYIGHDTIVHLLLEAGVSVNVPTPEGQTPLMLASSCGNESIAYFLLQVSCSSEGGLPQRKWWGGVISTLRTETVSSSFPVSCVPHI